MDEQQFNRSYLPRLPREFYQSDSVTFWTMPISYREQGWLNDRFHSVFRELLLHTCAREHLFCPTYCLMPDHLVKLRNQTDVLAQHYAVTMNLPLNLNGNYVVYEDAEIQTTEEGSSGILSFSNARGTPLFPRSSNTRRIGFRFVSYVSKPPTKYVNELRYVVFADEMPKLTGVIPIESLLSTKD